MESVHTYVLTRKTPTSKQLLFSPENILSGGENVRIIRIKETITNDCETNSPFQHHRKCMGNSVENMHSDVKV